MKTVYLFLAATLLSGVLTACAADMTIRSAQDIRLEIEEQPADLDRKGRVKDEDEIFQRRDQLRVAEKHLQYFLPKVLPGTASGKSVTIKVGTNILGEKYGLPKLEREEFIIAFPDPGTIVIAGGDQIGARNGVMEFLRRYAGVRWLFPGEAGLHVPEHAELRLPTDPVREKPFFMHRWFSWPYPFENRSEWFYSGWAAFNRTHHGVNFHHHLYKLFPWSEYGKTHPKFYPKNAGENPGNDRWNPVLNAPGLTGEAVRRICEHFRKFPYQHSYSLGTNDYHRFEGAEPKGLNSVGMANDSDYYYAWVNDVIAGVTKEYPDKLFGMLAYNSVTDPPSFKLDPHAIPFICIDRMRWYDPAMEEKDRKRTEDWEARAARLGWYDYIYGDNFYLIPRFYTPLMVRYLRYAAQHNVCGYYAEVNNSALPTEGPKTWLILQLLWNPEANADALLDEWYDLAVGKEAAPHLRNYFDHWEEFWREKVTKSEWFDRYKDWVYFDFLDQNYMKEVSEADIAYCDKEMEQVVAKAGTAAEKRRAELFMESWRKVRGNIRYSLRFYYPVEAASLRRIFYNDFNKSDSLKDGEHPIPDGWIFWQRSPGKAKGYWSSDSDENGKGALVIDLTNSITAVFARAFKPKPGKIYRFRCRIQAEDTGTDGRISVLVSWRDGKNAFCYRYNLTKYLGPELRDGKWHTVEIQFTPPPVEETVLNLQIGAKGVKQGKLRLDEAELVEIIPAGSGREETTENQ